MSRCSVDPRQVPRQTDSAPHLFWTLRIAPKPAASDGLTALGIGRPNAHDPARPRSAVAELERFGLLALGTPSEASLRGRWM